MRGNHDNNLLINTGILTTVYWLFAAMERAAAVAAADAAFATIAVAMGDIDLVVAAAFDAVRIKSLVISSAIC